MKTLADTWQTFDSNKPGPDDTRVTDSLKHDPRFVLVGEDRKRNQAIFRRVNASSVPER
jgi:hypothetical protein